MIPVMGEEKMNILFIAADDMNCDLEVYGNSQVKTPNLNRLAAMGIRFDNAHCQQPLCGPSRASLMTGLRPDTLNLHTLKHEMRLKNPDVVTLGQLFNNPLSPQLRSLQRRPQAPHAKSKFLAAIPSSF